MKAVFLDYATMGPDLDLSPLSELVDELDIHDTTEDDQVSERIVGSHIVFTNKIRFTDETLSAAPDLGFIGLTATGTDNIDLEGAAAAGIAVSNIRAYCTQSVVEHVFGTLLMLTHNLHNYAQFTRQGGWQRSQEFCPLSWPLRQLSGMTLGIVGFGELGRGVARAAQAFGMRVVVSARPGTDDIPADREPLEVVLETADVLSLHCPLTEQTRRLIDRAALARMKRDAILINTARGALVDTAALAEALRAGTIAAAAIDVLPQEPPVDGDPLLDYAGDNLIVTPHIAWATREARQNAIAELALNTQAFLNGERRNRVV